MTSQLTIDFAVDKLRSFDNFFVEENEALVDALKRFVAKELCAPSDSLFYLHGSAGLGKSHLLEAVCQMGTELGLRCQYVPVASFINMQPEITFGMEAADILCIDDIGLVEKSQVWQEALFDLVNRVIEQGHKIIFSSQFSARESQLSLADLESRLEWGETWKIKELDDEQQIRLLQFRANCKGMSISNDVAQYIHHRLSRDIASIIECLDSLDAQSLAEQRKLTIPFIKTVMDW
ncbi:DnaA regulatory inactivator Hda [Saccharobesus litoralis]|uniref:DnaA regulatory inactivator Hda n=1 Tax=Saccharobesus litoralis TaxID=2172099 RepID=A0A2S0VU44_9ALTE|nr:DnaA regulatory inactivator Hda [Saccharobesus litoralis]AWB67737.1 DnaA regulatory inactivator Hda [Saccharobesus litoralis]